MKLSILHDLFQKLSHKLIPGRDRIDRFEKMRACAGALFGLVLTGICSAFFLPDTRNAVMLIAPMGASAVLLFAVPASPLAQPWSILGGNLIASLVGVTCGKLIGDPMLAAAIAGAVAIGAMFMLRCLHPPSGAVALTAVLGGPAIHAMGYGFVATPVMLNSLLLLAAALFYNNATGRRYPHRVQAEPAEKHDTGDAAPTARLGITSDDLDAALARYNQVLDISREDLQAILLETEMRSHQRRFGVTRCSDVMSRDVVRVLFGTPLQEAWDALHEHRLTALPVVGRGDHVVGIITKADFIKHARSQSYKGLGEAMKRLLEPVRQTHSIKPEVVGQIMNKHVRTVRHDQPVVELVPLMSDAGLHSLPVVDDDGRLVGIMTQSDMIATLYEKNLGQMAGSLKPAPVQDAPLRAGAG
ncbi:HPP family protein [Noviherbaspirillum suwonense]|uniref:CBS domain-containing membrane protein n=1 Tax=Noviherbaspirillum suwonense TaxID=1224511 RepID=A0ABY1QAC0_9BURK|nr:CBS domain-containing membrane protein [Noviherbaspirillum suwonense]